MIMMPSCPYFIFINTSISKQVDIFFDFGFSLEDKRGLSLGELIRPFCIMLLYRYLLHYGCYYTLCHNTYAYSLLFYKVYVKRENTGNWNSAPEKAHQSYLFCTTPNKLKLHKDFLWNI